MAEVWAAGEAAASLGFAAARCFDELDPIEKEKDKYFREKGIVTGKDKFRAQRKMYKDAVEYIEMQAVSADQRDQTRFEALSNDLMVKFTMLDSEANVLCPACKLWNTGHGATKMREAVAMMGGYGITEDCPGFLGQKWMDSQLEATYEGPEVVQRRQLSITMSNPVFLAIEEKLAAGLVKVTIITSKDATKLITSLKARKFGITSVSAMGSRGNVRLVISIIPRKKYLQLQEIINEFNPKAFVEVESIRQASKIYSHVPMNRKILGSEQPHK